MLQWISEKKSELDSTNTKAIIMTFDLLDLTWSYSKHMDSFIHIFTKMSSQEGRVFGIIRLNIFENCSADPLSCYKASQNTFNYSDCRIHNPKPPKCPQKHYFGSYLPKCIFFSNFFIFRNVTSEMVFWNLGSEMVEYSFCFTQYC
jgi:hypothetical protein